MHTCSRAACKEPWGLDGAVFLRTGSQPPGTLVTELGSAASPLSGLILTPAPPYLPGPQQCLLYAQEHHARLLGKTDKQDLAAALEKLSVSHGGWPIHK